MSLQGVHGGFSQGQAALPGDSLLLPYEAMPGCSPCTALQKRDTGVYGPSL